MNYRFVKRDSAPFDSAESKRLSEKLGLHSKLVELLFSRGIRSEESIQRFLTPDQAGFHDPYLMKGMSEAVIRIKQAIENRETVVVYGDYDADGICASAILTLFLVSCGVNVYPHIPSRSGEGYGLSFESLERIIESAEPDLILTCDCGISAKAEVAYCLDLGVDIIVTDHHEVSDSIPECIVVNPKQSDCSYPIPYLCGAGVALKVVEALGGREVALQYLDLAALATVADLVPLLDENRLIVQLGLKREHLHCPGLIALIKDQELSDCLTSGDVAFRIAPRINAAGRMGDAYRAFELLTTTDPFRIKQILVEINADNQKRKALSDEMYAEAVQELRQEDLIDNRAIVLSHPAWEKGITGILAARIAGDYRRPTFVIVDAGTNCKGTCRSFGSINIYEVLTAVSDLLIEFGGHSQAAGFSIAHDNVEEFGRRVNECLKHVSETEFLPTIEYDIDVEEHEVDIEFVKALELIEPVGNSFMRPVFRCVTSGLALTPCKNNYRHTNLTTKSGLGILAFNYYNQNQFLLGDDQKELALEFSISSFGKKESVKAVLRGVSPSKLYINDEIARANYLKNASIKAVSDAQFQVYAPDELTSLLDDKIYGTLIVAGTERTYENFILRYAPKYLYHEFMYSTIDNNLTRIIVSPVFDSNFDLSNYGKIIFLDSPIGDGLIPFLNRKTNAKIYVPKTGNAAEFLRGVDLSRTALLRYYDYFRRNSDLTSINVFSYYHALKKRIADSVSAEGFITALLVFLELNLIGVSQDGFSITVHAGVKADLGESKLYAYLTKLSEGVSHG